VQAGGGGSRAAFPHAACPVLQGRLGGLGGLGGGPTGVPVGRRRCRKTCLVLSRRPSSRRPTRSGSGCSRAPSSAARCASSTSTSTAPTSRSSRRSSIRTARTWSRGAAWRSGSGSTWAA
jgi:hypothetical protein